MHTLGAKDLEKGCIFYDILTCTRLSAGCLEEGGLVGGETFNHINSILIRNLCTRIILSKSLEREVRKPCNFALQGFRHKRSSLLRPKTPSL